MTKKILLPIIAALAACSAHAIKYDVTLSGDLTANGRTGTDPLLVFSVDAWSFEFQVDAASEPATFAELLAALPASIGDFGVFKLFNSGSLFASRAIEIKFVSPPEFIASEGWTTQNPANVTTWAWNSYLRAADMELNLELNGNNALLYTGTLGMEVSAAAVPDSSSTAALAGLGLFSLLIIRRKLASSC